MTETDNLRYRRYSSSPIQIAQVDQLKGRGEKMMRLIQRLKKIAQSEIPVLILGETGVGKELCAKAVHLESQRVKSKMISVNCAAIPSALLSAELFGSERNAYTGASERRGLIMSAHQGTLFLDEVGELSLEAQAALLRVLETGELRRLGSDLISHVDIRLVCATHRDLSEMVKLGSFRADLFHRIAVGVLRVPPLRERVDDLPYLVAEFSELVAPRITEEGWTLLTEYAWPGNIRELKNMIRCIELEYPQGKLHAHHLPIPKFGPWRVVSNPVVDDRGIQLSTMMFESEYERCSRSRALNDDHLINRPSREIPLNKEEGTAIFIPSEEKFLVTGDPNRRTEEGPFRGGTPPAVGCALDQPSECSETSLIELIGMLPPLSLEELKRAYVKSQYNKLGENISETSRQLKLSRGTVYRLLGRERLVS